MVKEIKETNGSVQISLIKVDYRHDAPVGLLALRVISPKVDFLNGLSQSILDIITFTEATLGILI
jgi:hypothetical protein